MNQIPIAVVTGGNRGMGLTTCKALADKGFHVLLASRNLESGKAAAKVLSDQGLSIEAVKLEVTSQTDIDSLADYLRDTHGRVDAEVSRHRERYTVVPCILDNNWKIGITYGVKGD